MKEWANVVQNNLVYDKKKSFSANDFDLALRDFGILNDGHRYLKYAQQLHWFELLEPNIYTKSFSAFLNYLTYAIVIKVLKTQTFNVAELEKYFTDQVIAFLTDKKEHTLELKELYNYWQNTLKVVETVTNQALRYKKVNTNSVATYVTSYNLIFDIPLPLVGWDTPEVIDCILLLPFSDKKPNWYNIPSLYKVYSHFARHDIVLGNLYIYWFDLNSKSVKPVLEKITLNQDIATLIARYTAIEPYPFENIFHFQNPKCSAKLPLKFVIS